MLKLRSHREERGWSKAELARRAELNATTVGWIESGRFRPYRVQVEKLAKALDLTVEDLERCLDDTGSLAAQ